MAGRYKKIYTYLARGQQTVKPLGPLVGATFLPWMDNSEALHLAGVVAGTYIQFTLCVKGNTLEIAALYIYIFDIPPAEDWMVINFVDP